MSEHEVELTNEEREQLAIALGCEFHDADYGECAACASHAEQVWDDAIEKILAARLPRVGTLSDETCRRCGGENITWFAPSPLWNFVMRGNDINGEPLHGDLVCLRCFVVLAEEAGIKGRWRLTADPEPDGLVYETPSGRIWDPERWQWVEEER